MFCVTQPPIPFDLWPFGGLAAGGPIGGGHGGSGNQRPVHIPRRSFRPARAAIALDPRSVGKIHLLPTFQDNTSGRATYIYTKTGSISTDKQPTRFENRSRIPRDHFQRENAASLYLWAVTAATGPPLRKRIQDSDGISIRVSRGGARSRGRDEWALGENDSCCDSIRCRCFELR